MAETNPHPDPALPPTNFPEDGATEKAVGLPSLEKVNSSISKAVENPSQELKKYASSTDELLIRLSKWVSMGWFKMQD